MIFARYVVEGATTPITICPIGDIQWNGDREELAYNDLVDHVKWCLSLPNPAFVGMGDYVDFASPSNRAVIVGAPIFAGPRKAIDDTAQDLTQGVYDEILYPTKGKWAGMVAGHHYFPLQSGGNTDIRLCELLNAPYLGTGVAILHFEFREKGHRQAITVWVAHGKGFGRSASRPSDMLAQVSSDWETVDVFLMGHHTKKCKADKERVYPIWQKGGNPRLHDRTVHLVGTGGWQKAYSEGTPKNPVSPTYVEEKLYGPVALGAPVVHVRPTWKTRHGIEFWDPRITVEV